jgi:hypothetical protein
MTLQHQGVFHHRSLFAGDGFDEAFPWAGDYEFLLRELRHRDALFVEDVVVAGFVLGGQSNRPAGMRKCLQEIARARRKNRIPGLRCRWWWLYAKVSVRVALDRLIGSHCSNEIADAYRRLSGRPPIWTR